MKRELLIIGAGTAGLVAGIYAVRHGYTTTIVEMGTTPGGLCTSWTRKGYQFDGSAAGLAGTGRDAPLWQLWKDCGVIDYCPLHDADNFGTIMLPGGRRITVYTNIDRLESQLIENFPVDRSSIFTFIRGLRQVLRMDIPFNNARGVAGIKNAFMTGLKIVPAVPAVLKFGSLSLREFIKGIMDPDCVNVFSHLVHFGGLDVPMLTVMLPIAHSHRKMTGIPVHGWLSFARAMEKRFLELGGTIKYGKKACTLAVENGTVTGVIFADGSFSPAERVLSTNDGFFTQSTLLSSANVPPTVKYDPQDVSDQPVQVSIGVADELPGNRGPITIVLDEQVMIAGCMQDALTFHVNYYNPSAAPYGKSSIIAFVDSNYRYWEILGENLTRYREEKEKCASYVIAQINKRFPGFTQKVEVTDVATPLTRKRFTGNWMGAMQGRKADSSMIGTLLNGKIKYSHPDLKGFFMAGQWVESWGGITTAAQSGRNAIKKICKVDNVSFT